MAAAFQSNAFQNNAFQSGGATSGGGDCHTAFQSNAFQNNAFQICIAPASDSIGARITGGTFSRKRWREIVGARRELEERARKAKRRREREAIEEALQASAEALSRAELQQLEEAKEFRRVADTIAAAATATKSAERMKRIADIVAAAEAFRRYAAEIEDEEEAISLLMM